jgi:hypothetical protein
VVSLEAGHTRLQGLTAVNQHLKKVVGTMARSFQNSTLKYPVLFCLLSKAVVDHHNSYKMSDFYAPAAPKDNVCIYAGTLKLIADPDRIYVFTDSILLILILIWIISAKEFGSVACYWALVVYCHGMHLLPPLDILAR